MDNNSDTLNKLYTSDFNQLLNENEKSELTKIFDIVSNEDWEYNMENNSIKLRIKLINKSKTNTDPSYQKDGDSGFDLKANLSIDEIIKLEPMKRILIPTGLYFQIPLGFELQIRSRSGLAAKNGIMVLNSPGTVDSGYRGEIKIILMNLSDEPFIIKSGDRIAQGVIAPVQNNTSIVFKNVDSLDESDRGTGGFGHTGINTNK